jgi:hypothetical protein
MGSGRRRWSGLFDLTAPAARRYSPRSAALVFREHLGGRAPGPLGRWPVSPLSLLLRLPVLRFAADNDLKLANDLSSLSQPIAFGQRRLARVRREWSIFLFDCVKVLLIGLDGLNFAFGGPGHGVQFLDGPGRRETAGHHCRCVMAQTEQSKQPP